MLTSEDLDKIELACTGPDARETYSATVTEHMILEMVREIRRLRKTETSV